LITFAQNFEDVMLERLFPGKKRGFYVDIGAWDPKAYSVTRHFYLRGWRGLNIEPIAWRHAMFVENRPRDINLRGLVGSGSGPTRFYECVEEDYLSTTVADVAVAMRAKGLTVNEYDVDVERLDTLIERHCPKVIDFLKLDVEGSEADVLKTIDLKRFRPRALVIEATTPGSGLKSWDEPDAFASWGEWEEDVLRQGYVFARFDGLNRFYLRREDRKLAHRLALPPRHIRWDRSEPLAAGRGGCSAGGDRAAAGRNRGAARPKRGSRKLGSAERTASHCRSGAD